MQLMHFRPGAPPHCPVRVGFERENPTRTVQPSRSHPTRTGLCATVFGFELMAHAVDAVQVLRHAVGFELENLELSDTQSL